MSRPRVGHTVSSCARVGSGPCGAGHCAGEGGREEGCAQEEGKGVEWPPSGPSTGGGGGRDWADSRARLEKEEREFFKINPFLFLVSKSEPNSNVNQIEFEYVFKYTFQLKYK